mgnify:CR=1 FL=1
MKLTLNRILNEWPPTLYGISYLKFAIENILKLDYIATMSGATDYCLVFTLDLGCSFQCPNPGESLDANII